jgi:hypothetical protein
MRWTLRLQRNLEDIEKATRLLPYLTTYVILCLGAVVFAQAQNTQPNNTDKSSTVTTEVSGSNMYSRTTESHATFGNRRIDKQHKEVLGPDGDYQPCCDTETETIDVNPTTTRIIVRSYTWDGNGNRTLVQLTEEEAETSASGDAHVVRTMSNSDLNGKLNVVLREVADTTITSPNTQQLQSTTYHSDGSGGFAPYLLTRVLLTRGADHIVEVKTTTLQPNPDGSWKISAVKESTSKELGTIRTSYERTSQADLDGNLYEVLRTVAKETTIGNGEQSNSVDTYSVDVPGVTRDIGLHLIRRVTTVQQNNSREETTEQLTEEPDPNNLNSLRVTSKASEVAHPTPSGTQQIKTFQVRDINGTFNVITVETRKTSQASTTQAPTSPLVSSKP